MEIKKDSIICRETSKRCTTICISSSNNDIKLVMMVSISISTYF